MSLQDRIDEPPVFECAIVETDEAHLRVKQRTGGILYARLLRGRLPDPLCNVLVQNTGWSGGRFQRLLGRPVRDLFRPMRAMLSLPSGRDYHVNLLATLPPLADMRPHLRSGLRPPPNLDIHGLIPLAVEGLGQDPWAWDFRVTSGILRGMTREPLTSEEFYDLWARVEEETSTRRWSIRHMPSPLKPEHVERILTGLHDEMGDVRISAAYTIKWRDLGHLLPLEPFLVAAQDTRSLNEAACLAATFVFAAHAADTPVEAVIDLYLNSHGSPVKAATLDALGFFGDRAPIGLLAGILYETRAMYGIDERCSAANALGRLGSLAPVDALVAGMSDLQPHVVVAAAQALAKYPGPIPADLRARAELLSDFGEAHHQVYGPMLSRLRKRPTPPSTPPDDQT